MNNITESVLVESRSARSLQLSNLSNDRAIELLDKAKALVIAFRQGTGIATNTQLAEYYEVSEDVIQKSYQRSREEFEEDGVKVMRGKDLRYVVDTMSTSQNRAPSLTAWTPRGAVRLGMLLRDSLVARNVRSVILNILETKPVPTIDFNWNELTEILESKITEIVRRELASTHNVPTKSIPQPKAISRSSSKEDQIALAYQQILEVRDRWCQGIGISGQSTGDNAFVQAVQLGKVPGIESLLKVTKWGTSSGISRGTLRRMRDKLKNGLAPRNLDRPKERKIDKSEGVAEWVQTQRKQHPEEPIACLHRRMQLQHPGISISLATLSRWLNQ